MLHLIFHWLGLDNASGTQYLAWSGAGSDVGEVAIIGGLATVVRHRNCEVRGCWRLGRHVTAAGHKVCKVHSPTGAPSHSDVIDAHNEAKRNDR